MTISPTSPIRDLAEAAKTFLECADVDPIPDPILLRAAVAFTMLVRADGLFRVQPEGPGQYHDLNVPHAVAMIAGNFADDPPDTPERRALFAARLATHFAAETRGLTAALRQLGDAALGLVVRHRDHEMHLTQTENGWMASHDREEVGSSEPDFVSGEGQTPIAALDACADALDRDAHLRADLYEDDADDGEPDCLTCGGSGEVWSELDLAEIACPTCSGRSMPEVLGG